MRHEGTARLNKLDKKEDATLEEPKDTPVDSPDKSNKTDKSDKAKESSSKTGKVFLIFNLLLAIVIIAVLGFFGYKGWLQLEQQKSIIQGQQQQLQSVVSEQEEITQNVRNQLQANTLEQNNELNTLKETITAFLKKNQHTRRDWLVAETEYLIKLANHRLILANDVTTSIQALQAADSRLGEVGNPKYIPLRKALAIDIQKLKAIEIIDFVGISLTLNALQQQVETLPLLTPDPQTIKQRDNEASKVSQVDGWQQLPSAIWQDVLKLFRIQNHNEAIKPLLLPEQRFFLIQNLKLQLEQARLALLNNHPVIYKDRIEQAQQWINKYFDIKHPLTKSTNESLSILSETKISLTLPDISESLTSLQLLQPNDKNTTTEDKSPIVKHKNKKPKITKPSIVKPQNIKPKAIEETKKNIVKPKLPITDKNKLEADKINTPDIPKTTDTTI